MFVESFDLIRRIWADENFVHHGKYWTVVKNGIQRMAMDLLRGLSEGREDTNPAAET
jgi:alkanesulfonate monooxygenase SsuD/methylene tetrahydromethanopterin reductase-like flavin-dependent oxidoreductase (luciferase family)